MNSQSNSQNLGLKCGNKQQSVFQRSQSVGSSTLIVPSQVSPLSRGLQSSLLPQGQTISQQAQEFRPYQPGPRIKRCLSGTTQAVFVKSPPASAVSHVLQTVNVNEISAKMMTNQNDLKVIGQKIPEGLVNGSLPPSCVPACISKRLKNNRMSGGGEELSNQNASRNIKRFSAEDLDKINHYLNESLISSDTGSRLSRQSKASYRSNAMSKASSMSSSTTFSTGSRKPWK